MKSLTEPYIDEKASTATLRNWSRLGVKDTSQRLTSRANKLKSTKRFAPVEYFTCRDNIAFFESLAQELDQATVDFGAMFFSLGVRYLTGHGILDATGCSGFSELDDFIQSGVQRYSEVADFPDVILPIVEDDPLGILYQTLLTESRKNELGTYYTPSAVVDEMVSDIVLVEGQKVLDPCCGTLAYVLKVPNVQPGNIYACDIDPIAVLIAKFNFYRKFPSSSAQNIKLADYLQDQTIFDTQKFDYIVTNPPWGGKTGASSSGSEIRSGETFSLILEKSLTQLASNGELRILLPESVLNIRTHRDVRSLILNRANLLSITLFDRLFTGVTTKYIAMRVAKDGLSPTVRISAGGQQWPVERSAYLEQKDLIFRLSNSIDEQIIEKVLKLKAHDLSSSRWALGVVTGNNKEKLLDAPLGGAEAIYTGKEIAPYALKPAKKYIFFDRARLQQAARDEYYRADIKLVYKFISRRLTFAVDDSRSLVLNSANILIPSVPNSSIYSVAAFLNSSLYQYLYLKLFRDIKVLKGNLMQLPFPDLPDDLDRRLTELVHAARGGIQSAEKEIEQIIFQIYNLNEMEISRVKEELNGNLVR